MVMHSLFSCDYLFCADSTLVVVGNLKSSHASKKSAKASSGSGNSTDSKQKLSTATIPSAGKTISGKLVSTNSKSSDLKVSVSVTSV